MSSSLASESSNTPTYHSISVPDVAHEDEVLQKVEEEPVSCWRNLLDVLLCPFKCVYYLIGAVLVVVLGLVFFVVLGGGALLLNFVVCSFEMVFAPLLGFRKWLGRKHEWTIYCLAVKTQYREAQFYRDNAKRFDEIEGATTTKHLDKPLRDCTKAQIEAVASLIDGGKKFIEVKDTMSLSSVVVSTIFFVAYLVYFWHKGFVISDVNSKVHDALAIILPLLLTEELAAGLSQVQVWWKWDNYNNKYESSTLFSSDGDDDENAPPKTKGEPLTKEEAEQIKLKLNKHKMAFDKHVNEQCSTVGVGAA
ncbi:hypothetical protein As57867_003030, partial [Aphanomyces stellatus]